MSLDDIMKAQENSMSMIDLEMMESNEDPIPNLIEVNTNKDLEIVNKALEGVSEEVHQPKGKKKMKGPWGNALNKKPKTSPKTASKPSKSKTKSTRTEKPEVSPKAKKAVKKAIEKLLGRPLSKKLSLLDAAFEILKKSKESMNCGQIIEAIFEKKLWKSNGATPANTLNSALHADIAAKGKTSRFVKADGLGIKGQFLANPEYN